MVTNFVASWVSTHTRPDNIMCADEVVTTLSWEKMPHLSLITCLDILIY